MMKSHHNSRKQDERTHFSSKGIYSISELMLLLMSIGSVIADKMITSCLLLSSTFRNAEKCIALSVLIKPA